MRKTKRAFRATAAGAALAATISHAAQAACVPGDLAGEWSMYSTAVGADFVSGDPVVFMERCAVTLTNAGSAPARYSIDGTCRAYTPSAVSTVITVSGDASLSVTRSCSLRGQITFTQDTTPSVLTIVDARVEDQTRKGQINGVGRVPSFLNSFIVFNFNFTR